MQEAQDYLRLAICNNNNHVILHQVIKVKDYMVVIQRSVSTVSLVCYMIRWSAIPDAR